MHGTASKVVADALERCLETHAPRALWVGFSGGIDSTALLLAAAHCRSRLTVRAIHINHGLHAQADAWQQHCGEVCAALGIDLTARRVSVASQGNLEANAREARYGVFAELVGADELLLLGHHADDQLETVLQRLFRGRGLLPMRPYGALGAGKFARPLLPIERTLLEAYVRANGVAWIEDPSNADEHLERNFLRHQILPELKHRWRRIGEAVTRVAHHSIDLQTALRAAMHALGPRVPLAHLPAEPAPRRAWLRAFAEAYGTFDITDRALDAFFEDAEQGRAALLPLDSGSVRVWRDTLYYVQALPAATALPYGRPLAAGDVLELPHGTLSIEACAPDAGDAFAAEPLTLAFRRGGERLAAVDGQAGRALSEIFSAAGLAPWWRDVHPLILRAGALVAVPGIAVVPATGGPACRAVWQPLDPGASIE